MCSRLRKVKLVRAVELALKRAAELEGAYNANSVGRLVGEEAQHRDVLCELESLGFRSCGGECLLSCDAHSLNLVPVEVFICPLRNVKLALLPCLLQALAMKRVKLGDRTPIRSASPRLHEARGGE